MVFQSMMARVKRKKSSSQKRSNILSSTDSYKSLVFGIATVLVIFLIGFFLVGLFVNRARPEIDGGAVSVSRVEEAMRTTQQGAYTVKEGDSLWSIAKEKYNDGFKWKEIAEANNLSNPDIIEVGIVLHIPKISTATPVEKITASTYVVKQGDDLWNIAVRSYGDGFRWVDIARANNLSNPDLIHKDNKLIIPR